MGTIEDAINGVDVDDDKAVEEMLKGIDRLSEKKAEPKPEPKMEVITPPRPTKLLVNIPAGNPNGATVTRVEVQADGNFKVVEAARAPTGKELALIKHGNKEVLSGPEADTPRPWWHWALAGGGLLAVGVGGYLVKQRYFPADEIEEEDGPEDEDDDDDDED